MTEQIDSGRGHTLFEPTLMADPDRDTVGAIVPTGGAGALASPATVATGRVECRLGVVTSREPPS